jgi:glycosyltransferase involved in cell wall biosynthesis
MAGRGGQAAWSCGGIGIRAKLRPSDGVSVVVPVRNEEHTVGPLLEDLIAQTRRPDEVVVVDGGSTDRTAMVVQSYIDKGYPIRVIRTAHAYPGEGRNRGID